jgi:tetratricopeptide (TPR) repeat protein
MKISFKIFWTLFMLCMGSVAGRNETLDSLKRELGRAMHDTTRCSLLAQLAESAPDGEWETYNAQLQELAEKNAAASIDKTVKQTYLKYLANALNNMGYLANQNGEIETAISFHNKSLAIAEEIGDTQNTAYYLINIGSIYERQGNINKALNCYARTLQIGEASGDNSAIAYALNNIGTIYHDQKDLPKALDHFFKSLKCHEKINEQSGLAQALNNIGLVYFEMGNTGKALEYYTKSLSIREKIKDIAGVANSYNNLGKIYNDAGDLMKALDYYTRSLKLREQVGNKYGVASSLNNIGGIYVKLALQTTSKTEKISRYTRALQFSSRSLQMSRELGYPENISNAAGHLRKIYQGLNEPVKALEMYELFVRMRDSISNEATHKAAKEQQFRYEWEKHEAALKAEQEIKDTVNARDRQQQKMLIYFVAAGLCIVVLFSVFLFTRFRVAKKQKLIIERQKEIVIKAYAQLHEKNKEVVDSIYYARRIQRALLTSEKYINRTLNKLHR